MNQRACDNITFDITQVIICNKYDINTMLTKTSIKLKPLEPLKCIVDAPYTHKISKVIYLRALLTKT